MPEPKLMAEKFKDMSPEELYGRTKSKNAKIFFSKEFKPLGIQINGLFKWTTALYSIFWLIVVVLLVTASGGENFTNTDFLYFLFILEPVFFLLYFITRSSPPIQLSDEGISQKSTQVSWSSITKMDYFTTKGKIIVYSNVGNTVTFFLRRGTMDAKKNLGSILENRSKDKKIAFNISN